ncbi:MAG: class I SAM-dependent methyltransferase [Thermoleophilaceae bacterium]|nr:class I SAM-dependent methyltransferase [Thermoleophilaceae bacterium]
MLERVTHTSEPSSGAHSESESAPERFDPATMRGELIEAEHLARYHLAAASACGCRILDAGSGWGYGSNILADAGAESVIGIDLAESVVEAAGPLARENVSFCVGDVAELPFEDDSFDLVVCFEVIEHIERREEALAEFSRVLAPDGMLYMSSPNRETYGERNPHHVFEYTPDEFQEFLSKRFEHVRLMAQQTWLTSLISTPETFERAGEADLDALRMIKTVGRPLSEQTYMVALAGQRPLPAEALQLGVLTSNTEQLRWLELWEQQDAYLQSLQASESRDLWDVVVQTNLRLGEHQKELIAAERREFELREEILELREAMWTLVPLPAGKSLVRRIKMNRTMRKLFGRQPL